MTTPAHKGAGTDESTGLTDSWQNRPVDPVGRISSCVSFLRSRCLRFYSYYQSAGSTALCGSAAERQSAAQLRSAAGACPRPDAALPHPLGRQRVCGKPQWRLNDSCSTSTAAVVCAVRTLHYANARVGTPTDHGLSVSIPIQGGSE